MHNASIHSPFTLTTRWYAVIVNLSNGGIIHLIKISDFFAIYIIIDRLLHYILFLSRLNMALKPNGSLDMILKVKCEICLTYKPESQFESKRRTGEERNSR